MKRKTWIAAVLVLAVVMLTGNVVWAKKAKTIVDKQRGYQFKISPDFKRANDNEADYVFEISKKQYMFGIVSTNFNAGKDAKDALRKLEKTGDFPSPTDEFPMEGDMLKKSKANSGYAARYLMEDDPTIEVVIVAYKKNNKDYFLIFMYPSEDTDNFGKYGEVILTSFKFLK